MHLAGMTKHPDTVWMEQMARNAVDPESGYLRSAPTVFAQLSEDAAAPFRKLNPVKPAKLASAGGGIRGHSNVLLKIIHSAVWQHENRARSCQLSAAIESYHSALGKGC